MKTLTFPVVFTILLCVGCMTAKDIFKLSGRIENAISDKALLYMEGEVLDTISLLTDGSFLFEMPLDKSGMMSLVQGRQRLTFYGASGENLDIRIKTPDWAETVSFTGDLAIENEYFQERFKLGRIIGNLIFEAYRAPALRYLEIIDSINKESLNLLKSYEKKRMSPKLVKQERTDLTYAYFLYRANYPGFHASLSPEDTSKLPSDWFSFVEEIDFNNEELLDNQVAMSLIMQLIQEFAMDSMRRKQYPSSQSLWFTTKYKIIDSLVQAPAMNEFLKYDAIKMYFIEAPEEKDYPLIEAYLATAGNSEQKKEIQEKLKKWMDLRPGRDAPSWILPDQQGLPVASADLLGKYIYIDFWATWCAPCIAEIPHLEKLVDRYSDFNIEFVSISIDQDAKKWKEWVEKSSPSWKQIHDTIGLADQFNFRFIPAFVLIDPSGKIVVPNAPKPSSKEVLDLFDRLLIKSN